MSETIHASCVAIDGRAVLLAGPSGSGKSDVALRLIDRGAMLVSDDYTLLERDGDRLLASAPPTIAGKIEIRGIGIVDSRYLSAVPAMLLIDLAAPVERMAPDPPFTRLIAGIAIPTLALAAFDASTPIKIEVALAALGSSE